MSSLAQITRSARTDGIRLTIVKAAAATCCSRLIMLARDLDDSPPESTQIVSTQTSDGRAHDFQFSEMTAADVPDYRALLPRSKFDPAELLASGRIGFVTRMDGRLVSVKWIAVGTVFIPYLHRSLTLAHDEALYEGSFVPPELRGRGISGAGVHDRIARQRAAGIRWSLALVLPENTAGLRQPEKEGYRRIATLWAIGFGRRRRIVVTGPRAKRRDVRRMVR